jgi:hypothetical protein
MYMSEDPLAQRVPRRELFAEFAATAIGITLVNHSVSAENNPATQVTDRGSTVRITALKTYWVGPIVYVKIETNHDIVGWGDLKGVDPRVQAVG